jgi:hypothetical protein
MFNSTTPRRALLFVLLGVLRYAAEAQLPATFQKTFVVTSAEPVLLEIALVRGELQVHYSHDGEVAIAVSGKRADGSSLDVAVLRESALIMQKGNSIEIRQSSDSGGRESSTELI